jgi:MFS family permease
MSESVEIPPGKPSSIPGANSALTLLLAINVMNYVDRTVLAAVEPRMQSSLFPNLPADDANVLWKMGFLPTAFLVSYMLTAPIFGWLADRMSRWIIVGLGVSVWSLATGGCGLAATFTIMLLMRMAVGIGEAGYGPAAPTIISDLYPVQRRGFVLALFYMAIPVGSAIGYLAGGALESWLGWQKAFFVLTPPGILLGLLCFFHKDPPRGASDAAIVHRRAGMQDYLSLLKNRSYVLDTAGMAAMSFAIGGISFWIPKYFSETRHAGDLSHVNFVFGVISVIAGFSGTILGGLAGDKLRARFPGSYFLVSGFGILLCCPFILLMLYLPFPHAWIAIGIAEFWLFFNTGPSNTILANVTSPSIRSTAFAMNILVIHILGDVPSPPLLGWVAGDNHWDRAFMLVTAATALGGIFWILGARYLAEDTAKATRAAA